MLLTATPDPVLGTIVIRGTGVPAATITVFRYADDGALLILRGAKNMRVTSGSFEITDTEPPYSVTTDVEYSISMDVDGTSRIVQINSVTNPSVETGTTGWAASAGRTLSRRSLVSSEVDGPAVAGAYAVSLTPNTSVTTNNVDAPVAKVALPVTGAVGTRTFEASISTRLADTAAARFTNSVELTAASSASLAYVRDSFYHPWSTLVGASNALDALVPAVTTAFPVFSWIDPRSPGVLVNGGTYNRTTGELVMSASTAALAATNFVTNPDFVGSGTYTVTVGAGTAPGLTTSGSVASLPLTATGGSVRATTQVTGLTVGTTYALSTKVRTIRAGNETVTTVMGVNSKPASTTVSPEETPGVQPFYSRLTSEPDTEWLRMDTTFTATTTTETLFVGATTTGTASTLQITELQLSVADNIDYFSGATVSTTGRFTYSWSGTANASRSVRVPLVSLAFTGIPASASTLLSLAVSGVSTTTALQTWVSDASGATVAGTTKNRSLTAGTTTEFVELVNPPASTFLDYRMSTAASTIVVFPAAITTEVGGPTLTLLHYIATKLRVLTPTGSVLATSTPTATDVTSAGSWTRLSLRFAVTDTVGGTYQLEVLPEATLVAAQNTWLLDAAMLTPPPADAGLAPYFDGSTGLPVGYESGWTDNTVSHDGTATVRWLGTAHASASEVKGSASFVAKVSARLEFSRALLPIEMGFGCSPVHISDPVVPALGGWFTLQLIGDINHPSRSATLEPINRADPIVISTTRGSMRADMQLLVHTRKQRELLLQLLRSGRVLLVRIPDDSYPERFMYIAVGDLTESRIIPDHRHPYRRMTLPFIESRRPGGLIETRIEPTWNNVFATYDSWGPASAPGSVLFNNETWLEVANQPPSLKQKQSGGL